MYYILHNIKEYKHFNIKQLNSLLVYIKCVIITIIIIYSYIVHIIIC